MIYWFSALFTAGASFFLSSLAFLVNFYIGERVVCVVTNTDSVVQNDRYNATLIFPLATTLKHNFQNIFDRIIEFFKLHNKSDLYVS